MTGNNLEANLTDLLDKYSVEDILFTLYCCTDNRAKASIDKDLQADFARKVRALNMACDMMEEVDQDDSYCLVY
jgi:hypothetical protein